MKYNSFIRVLALSLFSATPAFAAGIDLYCESGDPSGQGSTLDIRLDSVSGDRVLGTKTQAHFFNVRTHRRSERNYFNSRILRGGRTQVIHFDLDENFSIDIRRPNSEVDYHTVIITPSEEMQDRGFKVEELSCDA